MSAANSHRTQCPRSSSVMEVRGFTSRQLSRRDQMASRPSYPGCAGFMFLPGVRMPSQKFFVAFLSPCTPCLSNSLFISRANFRRYITCDIEVVVK